MEPPSPLISWISLSRVETFPFAMRLNSMNLLADCCDFSFFHWLFPLSAGETSSIFKSTRERVDSKGLYGRWGAPVLSYSSFASGTVSPRQPFTTEICPSHWSWPPVLTFLVQNLSWNLLSAFSDVNDTNHVILFSVHWNVPYKAWHFLWNLSAVQRWGSFPCLMLPFSNDCGQQMRKFSI